MDRILFYFASFPLFLLLRVEGKCFLYCDEILTSWMSSDGLINCQVVVVGQHLANFDTSVAPCDQLKNGKYGKWFPLFYLVQS